MTQEELSEDFVKMSIRQSKNPSEYGLWQVCSEDHSYGNVPGSLGRLDLGVFEGTYIDVVRHAVKNDSFFSWGRGGTINKIIPTNIS